MKTIDDRFAPLLADTEPMGTFSGEFGRLTDEAKQAIKEDILEIVGDDEVVYMASPPPLLPVARNPHEIEEVRYQTNKLLLEAEAYKAAMVKHSIRQELRTKLEEYFK